MAKDNSFAAIVAGEVIISKRNKKKIIVVVSKSIARPDADWQIKC
jgi:hypothetical protein